MNWIDAGKIVPVSPEGESPEVLISVYDVENGMSDVYKGFYENGEWWTQWIHGCRKISEVETAKSLVVVGWMPLPEPYSQEIKR